MIKYLLVAASLLVLVSGASAADQRACAKIKAEGARCIVIDTFDIDENQDNRPDLNGATGIYLPDRNLVIMSAKAWEFRPDCEGYISEHELWHVRDWKTNPNDPWAEKNAMFYAPVYNCASFGVQYEGGQLRKPPGF